MNIDIIDSELKLILVILKWFGFALDVFIVKLS